MGNLLRNEFQKMFRRWTTWAMVVLTLVSVMVLGVVVQNNQLGVPIEGWNGQLRQDISDANAALNNPKIILSESMRKGLKDEIARKQYMIDHDISPNILNGMSFTRYAAGLIVVASIFTVVVAADSVAGEFTWGTVRVMVARPISRTKIWVAKYLASAGFALMLMVLLFGGSYVLGGILFGFGGADAAYVYLNGDGVQEGTMFSYTMLSYGLQGIEMLVFISTALLVAGWVRNRLIAVPLSLLILYAGNAVYPWFSDFGWDKYLLFANLDLVQFFQDTPAIPGMTFEFAITMLAIWFVILTAAAWWLFAKRDVFVEGKKLSKKWA